MRLIKIKPSQQGSIIRLSDGNTLSNAIYEIFEKNISVEYHIRDAFTLETKSFRCVKSILLEIKYTFRGR